MKIDIRFFTPGRISVTWQRAQHIEIKVDDAERRELLATQWANIAAQQAALEELLQEWKAALAEHRSGLVKEGHDED